MCGETSRYPFVITKAFNQSPKKIQKILVVATITVKAIRDIVIICIVFFLLWLCGYITLKQLLLLYFVLLIGIILSAVAPAISSIYSIPSEWIGLKPTMILFNRLTDENFENINFGGESELEKTVQTYHNAVEIISRYLSDSPDMLSQYPEISESFREIYIGFREAQKLHTIKKQQREEKEEDERQYVQQERRRRRLKYGVPPQDNCTCPSQFPIRATANLGELDARGIYYYEDERIGVEVYWCFASPEEAQADNFRRPLKKPPKQQPR